MKIFLRILLKKERAVYEHENAKREIHGYCQGRRKRADRHPEGSAGAVRH